MDKRGFRRLCRVMFALSVLLKVASWAAFVFSLLCIVNGNNWRMVLFLALSLVGMVLSSQMADATEDKLNNLL